MNNYGTGIPGIYIIFGTVFAMLLILLSASILETSKMENNVSSELVSSEEIVSLDNLVETPGTKIKMNNIEYYQYTKKHDNGTHVQLTLPVKDSKVIVSSENQNPKLETYKKIKEGYFTREISYEYHFLLPEENSQ